MTIFRLLFFIIFISGSIFANDFIINRDNSNANFSIKYYKDKKLEANFSNLYARVDYDEKSNTLKNLSGEVYVESLDANSENLKSLILSDKILDKEKFPTIKFTATKIDEFTIYGNLQIKDVVKNIELELNDSGVFFGTLYLNLQGTLKRSNFDLSWDELFANGSSAVADEIEININIEARKIEDIPLLQIREKAKIKK